MDRIIIGAVQDLEDTASALENLSNFVGEAHKELKKKDEKIEELESQIEKLEAQVASLEERIENINLSTMERDLLT